MKRVYFYAICLLLSFTNVYAKENYSINKVTTLNINSSINPATFNYIETNLKKLSQKNNDFVLIKLDTPGGLVTTTKEILTAMGSVDFPIAIWITPEGASATSAGAIIASGAHILVMSEGTNIGAATPIQMGKDIEQKDAKSKAVNDLVALVTSLSKARGRNPEHFEKMISEAESLDARTALKEKVIDNIINDQKELLAYLNNLEVTVKGKAYKLEIQPNVPVENIEMDPGQQILNIFANPTTAYVLFIIGAALIYFELQAPGGIIAGALGAFFLVLAAIGFQVLPLNMVAMGLIVLSFILFVLEAYITSFGVLTLAGLASLIFGSLFLFRTDNSFIELEIKVIISVVSAIAIYVGFIGFYFIKTYRKNKELFDTRGEEAIVSKLMGKDEGKFKYQVKLDGEIWSAYSSTEFKEGDHVKVDHLDNEKLHLTISAK